MQKYTKKAFDVHWDYVMQIRLLNENVRVQ